MTKSFAFISDIHGNIEALKCVLKDISKRQISFKDVYCLGDLVGYGPRPNEVIEMINKLDMKTVLGNYDEAVGFYLPTCGCNIASKWDQEKTKNSLSWTAKVTTNENKEFLREFEEQIIIEAEGYHILLTHASPTSINEYVYQNDEDKQEQIAEEISEDIIIYGHTHIPYSKYMNNKLFVNVGSVGRPKDGDNRACYCILDIGEIIHVEFVRISYDIETVAKEIEQSDLLNVFAKILRSGSNM